MGTNRRCLSAKVNTTSPDRNDEKDGVVFNPAMSRLPTQISSERADLLVQIARCHRLAKKVFDHWILAVVAEYEIRPNRLSQA
jgi:hypothetical protein